MSDDSKLVSVHVQATQAARNVLDVLDVPSGQQ